MVFGFEESPEDRLFKASLAFPQEERDAFLRASAGDDEELFQSAKALLEGYQELGGDESASTSVDGASVRRRWATGTEEAGTVIGRFTLLRKIGEGGMGTVWEAEQSVPIARRVAL